MLNTLATEPGSYASTAAKFPESAVYVPFSLRRIVDNARMSPVAVSITIAVPLSALNRSIC